MAELKWSGKEVIDFLNIFQTYQCLWDASSPDYMKRNVKEAAFNKLMDELNLAGLHTTLEPLKKKIKSLRDTYRNKLNKIKKSKKSGAGASEVYKPKLIWFSAAEAFWRGVVIGRESTSNLDIISGFSTQNSEVEEHGETEDEDNTQYPEKQHETFANSPETSRTSELKSSKLSLFSLQTPSTSRKRSPVKMLSPNRPLKSFKHGPGKKCPTRFEYAVNKLQDVAQMTIGENEDQYERFGKHISSQLRELPLRNFIFLQDKIQNLITLERLSCLDMLTIPQASSPSLQGSDTRSSTPNRQQSTSEFVNSSQASPSDIETCFSEEEITPGLDVLSQALLTICKNP